MLPTSHFPALLPAHIQWLGGPVTRAKLQRLAFAYGSLLVVGCGLQWASNDRLKVLGLGLILPGGGFLAHSDICSTSHFAHGLLAAFALLAFAMSVVLWFATGNVLAPPVTWLATAMIAAGHWRGFISPSDPWSVLSIAIVLAITLSSILLLRHHWARKQRTKDNSYLAAQAKQLPSIFTAPAKQSESYAEMSFEHLQRLRFALDRALQPIHECSGFERLDQFQTAATRYQINFLAYGISLTQARFTPALGAYMHQAQQQLIEKQTQHNVWAYWQLENSWGNLHTSPDPIERDNIMYTGFVALQMALYQLSTGRKDYVDPHSFVLVHPSGQHYSHHFTSMVGSLERNWQNASYSLMPCEPNWVYPLCNTLGACAMQAHDSLHQQAIWAKYRKKFRHYLETEFLDAFGRYVPCRSSYTGLAFPSIGGAMPQAMPCFFFNALMPDIAQRQWLLLRRHLLDHHDQLERRAFWPIDTGNYRFSRASAYTSTALAAAELGDETIYTACMTALDKECPSVLVGGVMHRPLASVWAHGVELMAKATERNSWQRIITEPSAQASVAAGPRLEGLRYPDVLVASAHTHGAALHAVLYPGIREGMQSVRLVGLLPGVNYRVEGAMRNHLLADSNGHAQCHIFLSGRTRFCITPQVPAS